MPSERKECLPRSGLKSARQRAPSRTSRSLARMPSRFLRPSTISTRRTVHSAVSKAIPWVLPRRVQPALSLLNRCAHPPPSSTKVPAHCSCGRRRNLALHLCGPDLPLSRCSPENRLQHRHTGLTSTQLETSADLSAYASACHTLLLRPRIRHTTLQCTHNEKFRTFLDSFRDGSSCIRRRLH